MRESTVFSNNWFWGAYFAFDIHMPVDSQSLQVLFLVHPSRTTRSPWRGLEVRNRLNKYAVGLDRSSGVICGCYPIRRMLLTYLVPPHVGRNNLNLNTRPELRPSELLNSAWFIKANLYNPLHRPLSLRPSLYV